MDAAIAAWQNSDAGREDQAIQSWAIRRGGSQQQLEAAEASDYAPPLSIPHCIDSELACELVTDWAMGLYQAPTVARLAAATYADYGDSSVRNLEVEALAHLADGGVHNCYRNLRHLYSLDHGKLPEPYHATLPLWNHKSVLHVPSLNDTTHWNRQYKNPENHTKSLKFIYLSILSKSHRKQT